MSRLVQEQATKGSQYWLQRIVNHHPDVLSEVLRDPLQLARGETIKWHSPLLTDRYAEYRDGDFSKVLCIELPERSLQSFWPSRGPQWDALGRTTRGDILLVEAKAHIHELQSDCGSCESSLELIQRSLAETGRFFGAASTAGWSHTYYQYANRLAHLYLLRHLNSVPAWLVFLYFINADDVAGPTSAQGWRPAIKAVHAHLDVAPERLRPYVVDLFLDVAALAMPGR